tara:strand:- start:11290 stop:11877 length:588 start_codon:yes stop_codon:yes gene_type:complete
MNVTPTLCLASTSPRRREILTELGVRFSVQKVVVDETPLESESPLDMVLRLAAVKAAAAEVGDDVCVLGSDTVVVLGDEILGKPCDESDAIEMLGRLSGRRHSVVTGVALQLAANTRYAHSLTEVQFREIGRDEARRYWQSGEPADKAGAYAIQGIGGIFVESIHGSYSGVVGLPVFETARLLQQAGIAIPGSEI